MRPIIPFRSHPIYTGYYFIQTNSINKLSNDIIRWIDNRNPGGIIYGRARIGKTRAIHTLINNLYDLYGEDLPILVLNMSAHKVSEKFLYLEMLSDIGHAFANSKRTVTELKNTLLNYLISLGKSSTMNRIIIFIDEANFLLQDDYNYLMDIYNRLERSKVQMTIILVGTEEIIINKQIFLQLNKQQIVGRFMVREHQFKGIQNILDLQVSMASYDYSEYPDNSGWSFTKYFFPEAFEAGKRIASDASVLFECFIKLNKVPKFEIPMMYITSTIENCFRRYGSDGDNLFFPSKEEWHQSIIDSGYMVAESLFESCISK